VNEVNGGDNVFDVCLSVFLSVRSRLVNQTSLKWASNRLEANPQK